MHPDAKIDWVGGVMKVFIMLSVLLLVGALVFAMMVTKDGPKKAKSSSGNRGSMLQLNK